MNTKVFALLLICCIASIPTALSSDICSLPHEQGICMANLHSWGYDPSKKECVLFKYGGCGGNENNFQTEEQCLQKCS